MAAAYCPDSSVILYLSQMEKHHSNTYRYTMTMTEPVCPETLQQAADGILHRFPTILAGLQPGFFDHRVVPAAAAPRVREDPGLLHTMTRQELRNCGVRIFYSGCRISMEAFHGMTDGYGATACFLTLTAEYLYLRYGLQTPERIRMLESGEPDWEGELRDAYRDYADAKPSRPRNRYAYQVAAEDRNWQVKQQVEQIPTRKLLEASRRLGVSMTALVSCVMAQSILQLQEQKNAPGRKLPVRIMVPIDLRRRFPSKTLRNFILYALPTMEPEDLQLPLGEQMAGFDRQLKEQTAPEPLAGQIAANVTIQKGLLFRILPGCIRLGIMALAYRFCGECNSSITLTNLGNTPMSAQMQTYAKRLDVLLTPRRKSPYNCAVISLGENTSISVTRFASSGELEDLFFGKLKQLIS